MIALVLLHFVEKNLAPLYHPIRTENQNQLRDSLACVFPRGDVVTTQTYTIENSYISVLFI